ncbi:MAG: transcription termination/antitermination protein NusA [Clostridia bacterium]|nr:transcription termination/antitermination protein NusA [Oscillospiraceae bacterium]MBP3599446.1 transcription termination/antitermination protein NusA [Clostridia bacterium]MEE1074821.1 transcription termination factor NusA [Acutalibacteraceae bacterium]
MAKARKKVVENDNSEFFEALRLMEEERGIPQKFIAEKISDAIVVAARKDYGGSDIVSCVIDPENKIFTVTARKEIVDEVEDTFTQISKEDAAAIDPNSLEVGFVEIKLDPKKFGRVVAQNSKNNFRQGVREAERGQTLAEFQSRNRELVTAVVQKIDPKTGNAILTIGHSEATLPRLEQVPDEIINEGDHIKVYVVDVKETDRGARIMLSRTHPGIVKRLFEAEVPEIFDGTVEIKSISRQAGSRTKIAVWSSDEQIDAIGTCIGPKGARVNKIVEELAGEKIDIVKYSEDPTEFITEALSPAKVVSVEILSEEPKVCKVSVPEAQLSLAIGNKGQNVRLAAKLTGWKIDIHPESGFFGE